MRVIMMLVLVSAIGSSFSQKTEPYNQQLAAMLSEKDRLYTSYSGGDSTKKYKLVSAVKEYIYTQLIDTIFPRWYGTEWDFNGYSNVPQKGRIACGYFVSTTLKHVGFNLNRYKLAQQYSTSIVKSLCCNVQYIRDNDIEKLLTYIDIRPNQLYVVGLDNHVGFISKENDGIYFIHSSYLDPVAVIKEKALDSEALNSSNLFVLGELTENRSLIRSWLSSVFLVIQK